ncbi:MAG: 1-(5-phosphoribosyl)-5-[(5-phosphoribosylamino)methylideneamino]imidazole-4-carboxamide isomerase [Clostridiales bacterium]|nr:1-(5-phosphoribosyl)-5-[(5-phosphoribosylamino)methylideneamino]imidazole-4-carboxamide isomerase [Clostridiales bacterium]
MQIFPAIDIFGGKAVRLLHGDYANMTVYSDNPILIAQDFIACGAKNIHIVDLEGAKTGETPNLALISKIAACGLFAEVGGGIRSEDVAARYLDAGVGRVILGTAAVTDPALLERLVARFGGKIAVSVDVKDGYAAIRGWQENSSLTCDALCQRLQDTGVKTVICTDISRDGAMRGTNRQLYADLSARYAMNFIASGGVSSMEDVIALRDMGVYGAIIGKAYYTGAIDLKKAIEVTA